MATKPRLSGEGHLSDRTINEMKKNLILLLVFVASLVPAIKAEEMKAVPLIPCNSIGAETISEIYIPDNMSQKFSMKDDKRFSGNTVILDQELNFVARTPAINGNYWLDGKKSAWQTSLNVNYAGSFPPPSLLEMDGKSWYLPSCCVACPLDNLCVEWASSGLIFKELGAGAKICELLGETLLPQQYEVYPAGSSMVGFIDKNRTFKLVDLKAGKVVESVADGTHWDIGNGYFVTPNLIYRIKDRTSTDISSLELKPYTNFAIKKDHIEFYADKTIGYPAKMLPNPQILEVDFNGKLLKKVELKLPQITKIIDTEGKLALLQTGNEFDSDPRRLWAMDTQSGKEVWSIDLEPLGSEVLKSWIVADNFPKLLAQTWTENLRIDINSGKIEKKVDSRGMQTVTKTVVANKFLFCGQSYVYKNQFKSVLVKTGTDGRSEVVGLPFEPEIMLLDSDERKIFIVSQGKDSIQTASVDAVTGEVVAGSCFDVDENRSVKLEKNFMAVDSKKKLAIVNLENKKSIEIMKSSDQFSIKASQSHLYVLCADLFTLKPTLFVYDSKLNPVSKTPLPKNTNTILAANDIWVVMNGCISDCNGNLQQFDGGCIKLDGNTLWAGFSQPKSGVYRINLATGEKTLLEGVSTINPIRSSIPGYNFDGFNAYDSDFKITQCPFRFTWAEEIDGEFCGGFEGMYGVAAQLKPSPSYSVEMTDDGAVKITNTSTQFALSGSVASGTFEGKTVSGVTGFGRQMDFPSLEPGQSFTFKANTQQNLCLAIVSNGMSEREVPPNKPMFSGTPISDKEPETIYIAAWMKTSSGFERLKLRDFDF